MPSQKLKTSLLTGFIILAATTAHAFHSGGVGDCGGCHSIHGGKTSVLKGGDASSTCLNCHQAPAGSEASGHYIATANSDMPAGRPPKQLTPGGDFGWLKKNYAWIPEGGAQETSRGERLGHNIVAADYGFVSDGRLSFAPGGVYPSSDLSCVSCHDPHGKYRRHADGTISTAGLPIKNSGSYDSSADPTDWSAVGAYRLLGGVGYTLKSAGGANAFTEPVPAAVAPSLYNRSEATAQTRVAYGKGISEWCANCHSSIIHGAGMGGTTHPAGNNIKFGAQIAANYTAYIRSGSINNADHTRGYNSLVPFEEGTGDYELLKSHARSDDTYLSGPEANANVSCLSCHRAHASGFDGMLRFSYLSEFMTVADASGNAIYPDPSAHPGQARGRTAVETRQAYYGRPASQFAPFQRTLCNKCHAKD